jgi:hypothetical protein
LKTFSNFLENCKGISFGDRRQCLMSLLPFSLYHEPEVSKESLEKCMSNLR